MAPAVGPGASAYGKSQMKANTLVVLLFIALILGGCSMVTTVVSTDVLRVTEGIVCRGDGRYRFETADADSALEWFRNLTVQCVNEDGAVQATVTGQAFGAYYLFLAALWYAALFILAIRGGGERPRAPSPDLTLSAEERARVQAFLDDGQKIRAIKEVREMTDVGLAVAKEYVEDLQREVRHGIR